MGKWKVRGTVVVVVDLRTFHDRSWPPSFLPFTRSVQVHRSRNDDDGRGRDYRKSICRHLNARPRGGGRCCRSGNNKRNIRREAAFQFGWRRKRVDGKPVTVAFFSVRPRFFLLLIRGILWYLVQFLKWSTATDASPLDSFDPVG